MNRQQVLDASSPSKENGFRLVVTCDCRGIAGIVYAHQLDVSIGQCVIDLELIAKASDSDEWINRIEYLPLK
jgi:hypothetical protein